MKESEAHQLLMEQSSRRGLMAEVRNVRRQVKSMLDAEHTPYPIVDSLVEAYLQGVNNNLYFAELALGAMIETNE